MMKRTIQLLLRKQLNFVPKNNFIAMLPGQKIMNDWNYDQKTFTEIPIAIQGCHSTKMLANFMKENLDKLSDKHVSLALAHVAKFDLELEDEFHDIVIPIVKEFLKNMDREHNRAFGKMIIHLGYLKVQNKELWELIQDKLLKEKMIRYLYLNDVTEVANAFQNVGVINEQIFQKLEDQLIMHRLALSDKQRSNAQIAFTNAKFGSKILFQALENPQANIEEFMKTEQKKLN